MVLPKLIEINALIKRTIITTITKVNSKVVNVLLSSFPLLTFNCNNSVRDS